MCVYVCIQREFAKFRGTILGSPYNKDDRVYICIHIYIYGGFPKLGVPFWGSQ